MALAENMAASCFGNGFPAEVRPLCASTLCAEPPFLQDQFCISNPKNRLIVRGTMLQAGQKIRPPPHSFGAGYTPECACRNQQ
jgi:hypothetical protein